MSDFSKETLEVFQELLNHYSLPATHPNFDQVAAALSTARRELAAAVAALPADSAATEA